MRKADIHKWLSGPRDYSDGVTLFKALINKPQNPAATIVLSGPETSISVRMLEGELRAAISSPNRPAASPDPTLPPATLPESAALTDAQRRSIEEMRTELKRLHGEHSKCLGELTTLLYDAGGIDFRTHYSRSRTRQLAELATSIDDKIREGYATIRHIEKFGEWPGDVVGENLQWICYALTNMYRWKNYIIKANSDYRKHGEYRCPARYQEVTEEMKRVEDFIKRHGKA